MNALRGLMNPAAVGQGVTQAFEYGQQKAQQQKARNALSEYAVDPDKAGNFEQLAQYHPQLAIQQRQQRQQAEAAAQQQNLQARAAQGDPAAMAQLAGIDLDAWRGLSSDQRQRGMDMNETMGNAAFQIGQLPQEQRAAAWDQQVGLLAQQNPGLAKYQGQYSDELLQSVINSAGMAKSFFDSQKPEEFNLEPGAGRYERDPITGAVSTVIQPNQGGNAAFSPVNAPPSSAIEALKRGEGSAEQFDQMFGQGAAARAMGGAGSNASSGF